jgi:hypothetical protein
MNAVGEVKSEKREFALEARRVTDAAINVKESEFINLAFTVKELALKKVKELIPESESIRDLTAVVKVMHEINTGNKLSEDESSKLDSKSPSVMLQIAYQQLNTYNIKDGKEKSAKRPAKGNRKGQTTEPEQ